MAEQWPRVGVASGALALAMISVAPTLLVLGEFNAWPPVTAGALAAAAFLAAWNDRGAAWSWIGSAAVLGGLLHLFVVQSGNLVLRPWEVAFLTHATISGLAGFCLNFLARRPNAESKNMEPTDAESLDAEPLVASHGLAGSVRELFMVPISQAGIASSLGVIPPLLLLHWTHTEWISGCLFWLAALWAMVSWTNRWPVLFAGFQAALAFAVGFAITHGLELTTWSVDPFDSVGDWRCLSVYGIGLGLLSAAWLVVRVALRSSETAKQLLDPPWTAFDRITHYGLIAVHVAFTVIAVTPGALRELGPKSSPLAPLMEVEIAASLFGPAAWASLAVLALGLLISLGRRWGNAETIGLISLALTVPLLIAGPYGAVGEIATASAIRWGSAAALLLCSAVVWLRGPLADGLRRIGCRLETTEFTADLARAGLMIGAAAPVLTLTGMLAAQGFTGTALNGPAADSVFHDATGLISNLGPMVLVVLAMVGFALREASPSFSVAGGLIASLTIMGGYALAMVKSGTSVGPPEFVLMIQLGTITAGTWAMGWLFVRPLALSRRELNESPLAKPLMTLQIALGAAGNVLLLVIAFFWLALGWGGDVSWPMQAGTGWGWTALMIACAAAAVRARQGKHRLRPEIVGLIGMTVIGLLACTVEGLRDLFPLAGSYGWGYRVMMLGWAAFSLGTALAVWWASAKFMAKGIAEPPKPLLRAAGIWVRLSAILAVLLGLKAALLHAEFFRGLQDDALWGAGSIALASSAGAVMAIWRRKEGWAFAAGLGVNLAASLVVAYRLGLVARLPLESWWMELLQANIIASSGVALMWLAARKRIHCGVPDWSGAPLLAMQVVVPAVANFLVLTFASLTIIAQPERVPPQLMTVGQAPGWVALLLSMLAVGWSFARHSSRRAGGAFAATGLAVGVLAACAASVSPDKQWIAYHALTGCWAATGLAFLFLGLLAGKLQLPVAWRNDDDQATTWADRFFSPQVVLGWTTIIGAALVAVAARGGWDDPARPYWSVGAMLTACLMTGVAGWRFNSSGHAAISGMLINAAASVFLLSHGQATPYGFDWMNLFALGNVIAFAFASALWTLVNNFSSDAEPGAEFESGSVFYSHVAHVCGLALLIGFAAVGIANNWQGANVPEHLHPLLWTAFGSLFGATALFLWDRRARLLLPTSYLLGLLGIALAMCVRDYDPLELTRVASVGAAGFALVAAGLRALGPWLDQTALLLRAPQDPERWTLHWFGPTQAMLGLLVVGYSLWVSLVMGEEPLRFEWIDRWFAILSVALLAAASFLHARQGDVRGRAAWRQVMNVLGVTVFVQLSWIYIPVDEVVVQNRVAVLFVASSVLLWLCAFGLPRWVPRAKDWNAG
ncbi:MAG: hypothetical protein N2C14_11095, partial [Planctomycetales bacterium]